MRTVSQRRSAPKQTGFSEAEMLSQFGPRDKGSPCENCQSTWNILIGWPWPWMWSKVVDLTNTVQQRTLFKGHTALTWGLKFHICNSHWIQYTLGFHSCWKGYQVAKIPANKIKNRTGSWLTFCMDYHMLKNQNFSLASFQPCIPPILPQLISMTVGELKHSTMQRPYTECQASILMRKITRQMFSKSVSQHSCVQQLLFLVPLHCDPGLHFGLGSLHGRGETE